MDNRQFKEEGFLGDDTFQNKEKELAHLCRIIHSTVERKVFTFQEALDAYEVTREQYDLYIAKSFINEVQGTANTLPEKENVLTYLKVTSMILSLRFENSQNQIFNKDIEKVLSAIKRLSKKVENAASLHNID